MVGIYWYVNASLDVNVTKGIEWNKVYGKTLATHAMANNYHVCYPEDTDKLPYIALKDVQYDGGFRWTLLEFALRFNLFTPWLSIDNSTLMTYWPSHVYQIYYGALKYVATVQEIWLLLENDDVVSMHPVLCYPIYLNSAKVVPIQILPSGRIKREDGLPDNLHVWAAFRSFGGLFWKYIPANDSTITTLISNHQFKSTILSG